jgi:hypothetical protein
MDIGFDQLLKVIKQLPAAKIRQLKLELSDTFIGKESDMTDFQKLLLTGPVMDDEQYAEFKETRKRMQEWQKK